jgi:Mor family transcriptional regulator
MVAFMTEFVLLNSYIVFKRKSIRDEFTGNNFAELAKKHGITPMRIRQVLEKGRSYSQ